MNWNTVEQAARLHYRLPIMRRRIRDAERILAAFLKRAQRPYLAYSAGKDSLAALDLTLRLHPTIDVVWHDEDWVLPGTVENIEAVERFYKIRIIRVRERFAADEFFATFGQWPVCLHPRPVDYEADAWTDITARYGWDGAIIALRSDESRNRRFALKHPLRFHQGRREWRVSPVHDWNVQDVWAYIMGNRLPYHAAYPQLIDAGVDPRHARIGPLTASRVYQFGALTGIRRLWPELWNAFVTENPCVQSAG